VGNNNYTRILIVLAIMRQESNDPVNLHDILKDLIKINF
jgi:hypothetical protein